MYCVITCTFGSSFKTNNLTLNCQIIIMKCVKLSITIDDFMTKVSTCIRAQVEVRPIISTVKYNSIPADGAQFISNLQSFSTTNFSFYYKKRKENTFGTYSGEKKVPN